MCFDDSDEDEGEIVELGSDQIDMEALDERRPGLHRLHRHLRARLSDFVVRWLLKLRPDSQSHVSEKRTRRVHAFVALLIK